MNNGKNPPDSSGQDSMISIAVIGNPNVGKTTLFNDLTGLSHKVANFPGVTVEKKTGVTTVAGRTFQFLDLPGTYSLAARSPDEIIATDVLLGQQSDIDAVNAIIAIVDASNLERNMYLVSQLLDTDLPLILALNMIDVAESRGITIDVPELARRLNTPVIPVQAHKGIGIDALKAELLNITPDSRPIERPRPVFPERFMQQVDAITSSVAEASGRRSVKRMEAMRMLVDTGGYAEIRAVKELGDAFQKRIEQARADSGVDVPLPAMEARIRYTWIREILNGVLIKPKVRVVTASDKIDKVLTHKVYGTLIFVIVMFLMFQGIFRGAGPAMGLIDAGFSALKDRVGGMITDDMLKSLVTDGIISGVGGVVMFLPQILILFLSIALLEDCGYMARAATLMDRLLSWCGLSGKSFVPMLSSLACAVPGIMATRTIENRRDRLATILIAPLMSCSARMPVYVIFTAVAIPKKWQGLTLFLVYMLGIVVAVPVAWILKRTVLRGDTPSFMMEMPSYKVPQFKTVGLTLWERGSEFLIRAGTIIFAVTIIVWALLYFPRSAELNNKYARISDDLTAERDAISRELDTRYRPTIERLAERYPTFATALADYTGRNSASTDESSGDASRDSQPRPERQLITAIRRTAQRQPAFREELERATSAILQSIRPNLQSVLDSVQNAGVMRGVSPDYVRMPESAALFDTLATLDDSPGHTITKAVDLIRLMNADTLKRKFDHLNTAAANFHASAQLRQSVLGRIGLAIEPVFRPMGWDWKLGVAALASFPAREIIISSLGTIYSLGKDQDESSKLLRERMREDTWPGTDRQIITAPTALSVMVFFALCMQCAATIATIKRETNSWKWPIFAFSYATALAYIAATITYQVGNALSG